MSQCQTRRQMQRMEPMPDQGAQDAPMPDKGQEAEPMPFSEAMPTMEMESSNAASSSSKAPAMAEAPGRQTGPGTSAPRTPAPKVHRSLRKCLGNWHPWLCHWPLLYGLCRASHSPRHKVPVCDQDCIIYTCQNMEGCFKAGSTSIAGKSGTWSGMPFHYQQGWRNKCQAVSPMRHLKPLLRQLIAYLSPRGLQSAELVFKAWRCILQRGPLKKENSLEPFGAVTGHI